MAEKQLRVAILGGGLAGAAAIRALSKIPILDVHIFESAPAFREAGISVGVNKNALAALDLLNLRETFMAAQPVQMHAIKVMVAEGKDTGKPVYLESDRNIYVVQRSLFLTAMLEDIDPSRLHPSKKATTIVQTDKEIEIGFEDGTKHTCDILLGADGIHSKVRKFVVGEDDPSAPPSFAGWNFLWTMVPFEAAQQYLGKELVNADEPSQSGWCGRKAWLMYDQFTGSTLVTCVVSIPAEDPSVYKPKGKVNKAELLELMKGFDHPVGKGMVELLASQQDEYDTFPSFHHSPQARRYVNDRVAIIGDAADANTPWSGSGGSMSLEDILTLYTLFGRVKDLSDARAALKAYETIRKPRRQRNVRESYEAGRMMSGLDEEIGLDPEKMYGKLRSHFDWIRDIDLKQEMQRAVEAMDDEKKRASSA